MTLLDAKEEILNGVSFLLDKVSQEIKMNQSYISDYLLEFIDDSLKQDIPGLFVYPHESVQIKRHLPKNSTLIMEEQGHSNSHFLSLVPVELYPIQLNQTEFTIQQGVKVEPKLKLHFEKTRGESIEQLMLHFSINRPITSELFSFILESPTLIVRNVSGIKVAELKNAIKRLKVDSAYKQWCYLNHYPNILSFITLDLSQAADILNELSVFVLEFKDKLHSKNAQVLNAKEEAVVLERNNILSSVSLQDIKLNHVPVALKSKITCEPFRIQPDIVHYPIIFDKEISTSSTSLCFNEILKVCIKDQTQTLELMPLNRVNPLSSEHQKGLTYHHTVNQNGQHQLTIPPVHLHKVLYADVIVYPEVKVGQNVHPKISYSLKRNRDECTMLLNALYVGLHRQFDDLTILNTVLLSLLPESIRPSKDFILKCTKIQRNFIQQGVWCHQTHFDFVLDEHGPNPILTLYWFKDWIKAHYPPTESIKVTLFHKEQRYDSV